MGGAGCADSRWAAMPRAWCATHPSRCSWSDTHRRNRSRPRRPRAREPLPWSDCRLSRILRRAGPARTRRNALRAFSKRIFAYGSPVGLMRNGHNERPGRNLGPAFEGNLDEDGRAGVECSAQLALELGRIRGAQSSDTEALRQLHEVRIHEIRADQPPRVPFDLVAPHVAVAPVIEYDGDQI